MPRAIVIFFAASFILFSHKGYCMGADSTSPNYDIPTYEDTTLQDDYIPPLPDDTTAEWEKEVKPEEKEVSPSEDNEGEVKGEEVPTLTESLQKAQEDLNQTRYDEFVHEQEKLKQQQDSQEVIPTYGEWQNLQTDNREPTKAHEKQYERAQDKIENKANQKAYYKDTR